MNIYSASGKVSRLTDYLYLTGHQAVKHDKLKNLGIQVIVNCTNEVPPLTGQQFETVRVNVMDVTHARIGVHFDRVADKIHQEQQNGKKILVHCVMGISRSSTICIAYFMKYHKFTLREALKFVRSKRAVVCPNTGFMEQLIQYEKRIHGKASVKMSDYVRLMRS